METTETQAPDMAPYFAGKLGKRPLFKLGQIVMTQGASAEVTPTGMTDALSRHVTGDWGDLDQEDKQANDEAIAPTEPLDQQRVLSAYHDPDTKTKFWIITEWDRSVTTVLLPEEY